LDKIEEEMSKNTSIIYDDYIDSISRIQTFESNKISQLENRYNFIKKQQEDNLNYYLENN